MFWILVTCGEASMVPAIHSAIMVLMESDRASEIHRQVFIKNMSLPSFWLQERGFCSDLLDLSQLQSLQISFLRVPPLCSSCTDFSLKSVSLDSLCGLIAHSTVLKDPRFIKYFSGTVRFLKAPRERQSCHSNLSLSVLNL